MASSTAPLPPRALNVRRFAEFRASELETLHSIVASTLSNDFRIPRGKRRRTTGHRTAKSRRRKRPKPSDDTAEPSTWTDLRDPPRRVRRRVELQKNPACGFCTSGDGTRRLRTHLWHAKRFVMVKQWGFYLPLGLHGRGRGSRAILKRLKFGALVHDASYFHPIQLEGPEDSILSALKMVLLASPSGAPDISDELFRSVHFGVRYENAMLYHVGTPSKSIAPVVYMWRPILGGSDRLDTEQDPIMSCRSESSTSSRQLWVWIHAAAFEEGIDALRFACETQLHKGGIPLNCSSLEGRFAKLDVMGSGAIQILQKILHPATNSSHRLVRCSNSRVRKSIFLDHAGQLPPNAILSLKVHDPRELPPTKGTQLGLETPLSGVETEVQNQDAQGPNTFSGASTESDDTLLSSWSKPEAHGVFLSDSIDLWDSSDKLYPPLPDNVLCSEKHQRRLNFFYLDHTPATEPKDSFSRSCSILLVKHMDQGNSLTKWSIILPLSWVKVFWMSLVSHGAHAIGLRERRWIASNNGIPTFPYDFPDSSAYSSFMETEAAAAERAANLRPPAVRPPRVPIPPPWDCLVSTVEKGQSIVSDHQALDDTQHSGLKLAPSISSANPDLENFEPSSSFEKSSKHFRGLVMRTPYALNKYAEKIQGTQLLLFPNMSTVGKGLSEDSELVGGSWITGSASSAWATREPCYVRILLHAFKEGSFEEGAIVCAPVLVDLLQWTSRSDDHEGLQIPQSSIGSYFTQQDSGKWELQKPEDCSAQQSYRWPIGFVTSGFVHQSSKPVAEALCEVGLLSLLRGQQWSHTQAAGTEIFVWVRNPRSVAYRRAMAVVILEQQKADLEFM